ncbi:hypothetical protein GCM10007028_13570 [Algibacter mikhailovii]|uniref:Outer membrane protein beta-barrel domain-containing protein n=2 Tax=Algibacter mikhailovii TaxID=425498 RepID=A0A918QX67_9FLAO|nr:hypothetical protein GCM10007028_13570 [Algibacter mikhailovii]
MKFYKESLWESLKTLTLSNYKKKTMNTTFKLLSKVMVLILLGNLNLMAQETRSEEPELKNSFLLNFGYTHIPGSSELHSEASGDVFVPAIGFDYSREISERWELILMLDFELGKYLVLSKELNRENAFMVLGGASYELFSFFKVMAGLGIELEKNENLFVTRLGGEFIHELNGPWGLMAGAYWDYKQEYATYSLVVGVGYRF